MASKAVRIRPLTASDVKHTFFVIGKANFENLAVANRKGKVSKFSLVVARVLCSQIHHSIHPPPPPRNMASALLHICQLHEVVAIQP